MPIRIRVRLSIFDANPDPDPAPSFTHDGKIWKFDIIHSSARLHGFIFLISDVPYNIEDWTEYWNFLEKV